jgi:phosphate starvation-inducible PhoH-like protein
LTGPEAALDVARSVLEQLYKRAAAGEPIGAGDFDGLIRHAREESVPGDGQAQIATRRRVVKARTRMQSSYMRALEKSDLVFGLGPAGTGKTYLAVAYAAYCLERGLVERIILSRPAVEAGERLGFLPGDMREKVDPYLRPLYDALYDVLPPEKVERDLESGIIEIAPLAFMRGRTLANAYVILDEAQNTTSMQMKMFLTRLGEGSKMTVTGDPSQIDLPTGMRSGLEEAVTLLDGVEGVEAIRFANADVVRRDLVARIVAAYDKQK